MLVRNGVFKRTQIRLARAARTIGDCLSSVGFVSAVALGCALLTVKPALSQEATVTIENGGSVYSGHVSVPMNKSKVLRIASPFKELMVGNKDVADVLALTDRTVYVLGKSIGATSLFIYDTRKNLLAVLDLQVTHDTQGLKHDLFDLMPDENVGVRGTGDGIVLTGHVANGLMAKQAQDLAERYAPGNVSNFLSIEQSQQVMLTVRFAEVKRSVAKKLGFNSDVFVNQGSGDFLNLVSGVLDPDPDAFASILGSFVSGDYDISVLFDALEKKGVMTTLAEPTLIALSGESASFLAGGEIPVPVGNSNNSDSGSNITIEYKEFGVSLKFSPTVVGDLIAMTIEPEVSALDFTNAVVLEGLKVPGLATRRTRTTVELRDGQSFAIAGLLKSEFNDSINQFPGLGDIPIIGALLRSSEYQKSETELVIIVTPHLVRPVSPGALSIPQDHMDHPSEFELFMLGFMEGHLKMQTLRADTSSSQAMAGLYGGGLDGSLGYINEEGASQ